MVAEKGLNSFICELEIVLIPKCPQCLTFLRVICILNFDSIRGPLSLIFASGLCIILKYFYTFFPSIITHPESIVRTG